MCSNSDNSNTQTESLDYHQQLMAIPQTLKNDIIKPKYPFWSKWRKNFFFQK